jgi:hypothetical protein
MSGIVNEDYSGSPYTIVPPCKSYGCNQNLTSSDPASQYQRLKLIQNTVRVASSLYAMNLAALNVYQKPSPLYNVNWNQMSDRIERHYQPTIVGGGSTYHGSSTKNTITRCRPGAGCPGGYGVDIKHNSYDRYLNRIKGKGPVRRGPIPPGFGRPILDPAVQGGKTMKTSIVSGCNCPIVPDTNTVPDNVIYKILTSPVFLNENYKFSVGQYVYAYEQGNNYYSKAIITAINGTIYTIQFDDGIIQQTTAGNLLLYFPCNCNYSNLMASEINNSFVIESGVILPCYILNKYFTGGNYINIAKQIFTGNNIPVAP